MSRPSLDKRDFQVPVLIIRHRAVPLGFDLQELWRFRDLISQLALRDLRLRYKQTALGVLWVVLQPLLAAGIFTFVFGVLANLPTNGQPAFLVSFIGLLGWNLFANLLTKLSACLTGNSHLISKVYFPRLVLPISTVPGVLVDFAVAFLVGAIAMAVYGIVPKLTIMLLPFWIFMLVVLAMGWGLIAASLSVFYRDVNFVLPVAIQMMLYASPVGYDANVVPNSWQAVYNLNPLVSILSGFRWSILGGTAPSQMSVAYSLIVCAVFSIVGLLSFRKMEQRFADVV